MRPKYVKKKTVIDFGAFCSIMPRCSLLADIKYAFCDRHVFDENVREYKLALAKAKQKQA